MGIQAENDDGEKSLKSSKDLHWIELHHDCSLS
jgi:hypothetical protein